MNKLLNDFKIDETLTKPMKKQKKFNKIKNNIPHKEDYNFMADLLMLPTTTKGFRYLLVVVDLWTDEFDIESLKNKEPKTILSAMKRIFKRPFLNKPYASISTDAGTEFKGVFNKYLYNESIFHKVGNPNRHTQQANVERLNRQLSRFLVGYMNLKEENMGKEYREWTDIVDKLRVKLNDYRLKRHNQLVKNGEYKTTFTHHYPEPKFKINDTVNYKLDTPTDALQIKRQPPFRTGDYRFSIETRKIKQILYFNDEPYIRYMLEGIKNRSFSENQLLLSKKKVSTYLVRKIIKRRVKKKKIEYLIWWKGYLKKDATWESKKNLIEDGFKNEIDAFEKKS